LSASETHHFAAQATKAMGFAHGLTHPVTGSTSMSLAGKWRIVQMPDFEADYPDMLEPAYIFFKGDGGGAFAFGCMTGHIWEASTTDADVIDFSWNGSDEMEGVSGDGDAELKPDGFLHGEISLHNGDEYSFIARKWTSPTAS